MMCSSSSFWTRQRLLDDDDDDFALVSINSFARICLLAWSLLTKYSLLFILLCAIVVIYMKELVDQDDAFSDSEVSRTIVY